MNNISLYCLHFQQPYGRYMICSNSSNGIGKSKPNSTFSRAIHPFSVFWWRSILLGCRCAPWARQLSFLLFPKNQHILDQHTEVLNRIMFHCSSFDSLLVKLPVVVETTTPAMVGTRNAEAVVETAASNRPTSEEEEEKIVYGVSLVCLVPCHARQYRICLSRSHSSCWQRVIN